MKTKVATLLGVLAIILAAAGLSLFPHSISCSLGIYETCEIYVSSQKVNGKKLSHRTDSFSIHIGADSLIDLYKASPQCHMYTFELKKAIQQHSDLSLVLQTAPCSSIGPFEAVLEATRRNSIHISKPGSLPQNRKIVYLFDGLADYKLAILNGETILETSKLR